MNVDPRKFHTKIQYQQRNGAHIQTPEPFKERRREKNPHAKHTTILSSNVLPCSYVTEGRLLYASTFHISHLFISYFLFAFCGRSFSCCVHLFDSVYYTRAEKYKCDNRMHFFRSFHSGMPFIFGIEYNSDSIFWQNCSCHSSLNSTNTLCIFTIRLIW